MFSDRRISGKSQFTGRVVAIESGNVVHTFSRLKRNHMVQVIAAHQEIQNQKAGDTEMLVSKAFNPVVLKTDNGKRDGLPPAAARTQDST